MLSQRSIKGEYAKQLAFSSVALIAVFSFILYAYIKSSLYGELKEELITEATYVTSSGTKYPIGTQINAYSIASLRAGEITILITSAPKRESGVVFREFKDSEKSYFQIQYPYDKHENSYVSITKDVSGIHKLLSMILNSIMIINFGGLILIQIYAFTLSKILSKPILELSNTLAKMNENMLKPLEMEKIPEEFTPLGQSLNSLIARLQRYMLYQKELFIGVAHELKTPLAVMKTKCEVVLIKPRETEKYVETLKSNIQSINEMNSMIKSVLDIGRQEGAQFEKSEDLDIMAFLRNIGENFLLLAREEKKFLILDLKPESLMVHLQPTLLTQIIQNFLQNALKFTPEGKSVLFRSAIFYKTKLRIEVIDEGCGLDGSIDIFAPFKRSGNKSGAGLGLFLAKSAADALNGSIKLENRIDSQGTVATLELDLRELEVVKAPKKASSKASHLWQNMHT